MNSCAAPRSSRRCGWRRFVDLHNTVIPREGGVSSTPRVELAAMPRSTGSSALRTMTDPGSICPATNSPSNMTAAPFCGWQIQDNGASVQGALEDAVKAICGERVRVHGAGRTDAGVHALGQVAHCDIAKHFAPGRFRDGAQRASAAASDRRAQRRDRARYVRGAVLGDRSGTTSIASQSPRQSRARHRPGLAAAAAARHRRDA